MTKCRLLSLLLALVLVFSSVSAMAEGINLLPLTDKPEKLTIAIASNATVLDWNTNSQTLYIEEVTGIDLEFTEIASNEYTTKVNLMLMAGDALPDIFIGSVNESTLVSWGETGLIIPLNEYYESGANAYMRESIEIGCSVDYDTFVSYMTCYDGYIYAIPSYSESYNNEISLNRLLIYQPWLDQLGIDRYSIKTTDDLYNVLCQFRDNDMNGNGDTTDEIPLIANTKTITNLRRALSNPFIYTQDDYLVTEDGKVDVVFDRDEFREAVKYVRKLVVDGLLMPESFTQDEAQMTALQTREDATCGVVARVSTSNISASDPKYAAYRHVITLTGPEGVQENPVTPSYPSYNFIITSACKNPDLAFKLGDYLCSQEMTIWGKFGIEGDHWREPEEGEVTAYADAGYETVIAMNNANTWANAANYYYANSGPRMYGTRLFFGQVNVSEGATRQYTIDNANDTVTAHTFCDYDKLVKYLPYTPDESDVYNSVYTPIVKYVDECWARFVLGDLDIDDDAAWQQFIKETEAMGLEDALKSIQAAYDRSKAE